MFNLLSHEACSNDRVLQHEAFLYSSCLLSSLLLLRLLPQPVECHSQPLFNAPTHNHTHANSQFGPVLLGLLLLLVVQLPLCVLHGRRDADHGGRHLGKDVTNGRSVHLTMLVRGWQLRRRNRRWKGDGGHWGWWWCTIHGCRCWVVGGTGWRVMRRVGGNAGCIAWGSVGIVIGVCSNGRGHNVALDCCCSWHL